MATWTNFVVPRFEGLFRLFYSEGPNMSCETIWVASPRIRIGWSRNLFMLDFFFNSGPRLTTKTAPKLRITWPLWGIFTSDPWIHLTNGSVFMSRRHHALLTFVFFFSSTLVERANTWLTENPESRAVSCETLVVEGVYNMGGDDDSLTGDLPEERRFPAYLNMLR